MISCGLYLLRLPFDGGGELLPEQEKEEPERDQPRCERGQDAHFEIGDKIHAERGREVDVGGVADDERHAPCVGGDKFGGQIGGRVDLCVFGEIADEGGEGEDDDVVGSKDGEEGDEGVERKKELLLPRSRAF